jgi:hypothetical protein
MRGVIAMRDKLMATRGWDRRVATMAARLYLGIDCPDDLAAAARTRYGVCLLTAGEFHEVFTPPQ